MQVKGKKATAVRRADLGSQKRGRETTLALSSAVRTTLHHFSDSCNTATSSTSNLNYSNATYLFTAWCATHTPTRTYRPKSDILVHGSPAIQPGLPQRHTFLTQQRKVPTTISTSPTRSHTCSPSIVLPFPKPPPQPRNLGTVWLVLPNTRQTGPLHPLASKPWPLLKEASREPSNAGLGRV